MEARRAPRRILVVDDESEVRDSIRALLETHGYETASAADGRGALSEVARQRPDVVLTDLFMPDVDGIELITELRECAPEIPIVAMANRFRPYTVDYVDIATKLGAFTGVFSLPLAAVVASAARHTDADRGGSGARGTADARPARARWPQPGGNSGYVRDRYRC